MTTDDKINALNNTLDSFGFDVKYYIYHSSNKFAIASKNSVGGVETHSRFYKYSEMNIYLIGYYNAKTKQL